MTLSVLHGAGAVTRFHTVRTIQETTVAHHSWGVCMVLLQICDPSANLLKAALYHDLAESVTGDIPATAKWASKPLADALQHLEDWYNVKYELDMVLSGQETALLKWADMFELILYAESEIAMGNTLLKPIRDRGLAYLNSRTSPSPQAEQLLKDHS